jgi:hypothetical protein
MCSPVNDTGKNVLTCALCEVIMTSLDSTIVDTANEEVRITPVMKVVFSRVYLWIFLIFFFFLGG